MSKPFENVKRDNSTAVKGGRVTPPKRPRYTLSELLALCSRRTFEADKEWLDAPATGKEAP